ncbi:MAG: TonB-dependent receptor [Dysgonomonas sp.]
MNPRISHKEFEKSNPADIFHILRNFAGVQVSGNNISIRGGKQPLILVDDMQYEIDMLSDIPISDIDEVEIIKDGTAAIFGMRGGNDVIMITTKRGEINFKNEDKFNIKSITPLGYQVTKEFYSPQYVTKEQKSATEPDLRTTVYWNPNVKITESGKADINFYTADASTTYSVVIEGITSDGSLIHSVHKISRKD